MRRWVLLRVGDVRVQVWHDVGHDILFFYASNEFRYAHTGMDVSRFQHTADFIAIARECVKQVLEGISYG